MWAALAPTETTARTEMTRSPTRGQIAPQLLDNGNRGEPNHEHRAALEAAAMRKTNTEGQESVVDLGRRRRSGVPEAEDFVEESRQRFDLRRGEREMRDHPSDVVGAMTMVACAAGHDYRLATREVDVAPGRDVELAVSTSNEMSSRWISR